MAADPRMVSVEREHRMSEKKSEELSVPTAEEAMKAGVEPETGRPRSSQVIGGSRSPLDDAASKRAGIFTPSAPAANAGRTGKKLSQWGASSRRGSYWKKHYY